MFTIRDIIDLALRIEKNAEKIYRRAAQEVSDPSISAMLLQLADDEVEHAKWFSELREKVTKAIEDPRVEERGKAILQGILGDQSFSLKDVHFSSIKEMKGLLSVAIEFEEDTLLFYDMIRSFIDEKGTLDHLDMIIEEENRHIGLLKESMISITSSESPSVSKKALSRQKASG